MSRGAPARYLGGAGAAVVALFLVRPGIAFGSPDEGPQCAALRAELFTSDGKIRDFPPHALEEPANPMVLGCRAEVAAGRGAALVDAIAKALPRSAGSSSSGSTSWLAVCALRPRAPWVVSWFVGGAKDGVASCLAASATVDSREARAVVDAAVDRIVVLRKQPPVGEAPWAVDNSFTGAMYAASFSIELYRRLGPSLSRAYDLRAQGYRHLHVFLCAPTRGTPSVDAATCARLSPRGEASSREVGTSAKVGGTALVLSLAGGVVAADVATRNDDGGRILAAGALGLGAGVALAAIISRSDGAKTAVGAGVARFWGTLLGTAAAVATTVIAYRALEGSTGSSRVIATSVGMSLTSLGMLTFIW